MTRRFADNVPLGPGLLRAAAPGYCAAPAGRAAGELVRAGLGLRHQVAARRRHRPWPPPARADMGQIRPGIRASSNSGTASGVSELARVNYRHSALRRGHAS